jgi:hypothetical protein
MNGRPFLTLSGRLCQDFLGAYVHDLGFFLGELFKVILA